MSNLWSAHLLRLRRSRTFWISMGIMAASGALEALLGYGAMVELLRSGVEDAFVSLDSRYVLFHFIAGLLLSVFCALFTGAEYSDGAMRRKLAAGHSRAVVYLSHLALSVMVGVLLCLGYIAAVLAVGLPLLGPLQIPASTILFFTLCAFVMTAALAALFTLISMLCQNKAVTAVASIFLAYFLLFLGIFFNSRLTEPEFYPARQYVEDGQIVTEEAHPNPFYVQGPRRELYQFFYDLPGCQAVQLVAGLEHGLSGRLILYSLAVGAASTGAGVVLFRKKALN